MLVLRYALFAALAIMVNLALQRLVMPMSPPVLGLLPALVTGTLGGLVLKYLLDKIWIFEDQNYSLAEHGRKFGLYSLMGIITTLIFWGSETGFWWIWKTEIMRETGALIGLVTGYVIKYHLDRRFVFGTPLPESGR